MIYDHEWFYLPRSCLMLPQGALNNHHWFPWCPWKWKHFCRFSLTISRQPCSKLSALCGDRLYRYPSRFASKSGSEVAREDLGKVSKAVSWCHMYHWTSQQWAPVWKHFCRFALTTSHHQSYSKLYGAVDSIGSPYWWVKVALMVPETWERLVKLPHDATLTNKILIDKSIKKYSMKKRLNSLLKR